MPNPSLVRRTKGTLVHTVHQALHIDLVRFFIARLRFEWFVHVRRSIRTLSADGAIAPNTVAHNLKGLRDLAVARSLYLIRPLSVLEEIDSDARVLLIGPRTEGEILALLAHGFVRKNITAVDLISYSPWIELGDMHDLPSPDEAFDVIVAGWVLAYSDDKRRAANEILRVARPGAVVALGVEWNSRSDAEIADEVGYHPGASERLVTAHDILTLFGDRVDSVLAVQEPAGAWSGTYPIVVLFRLNVPLSN